MPRSHLIVLAAAAALVIGCGGDEEEPEADAPAATATPAEVTALEGCIEAGRGVKVEGDRARFGSDGVHVVTVSGPGGDACQWQELATALADRGLVVDVFASGAADDAASVRKAIEQTGSDRVALLSTSAGSGAALEAAGDAEVTALVTLSATLDPGDRQRAERLGVPMVHIGSRGDGFTNAGADTRSLQNAGKVILVGGAAHGTELTNERPGLVDDVAAGLDPTAR